MAMSAFRRSVKAETKKGGKGFKGGYFDRWRFPQGQPTPILLINSSYVDPNPPQESVEVDPATGRPKEVRNAFFKLKKHRRRLLKNGSERFLDEICSAGHELHNPQPCVGCHAMDTGDKSVSVSDYAVFGIVHLHPYHGHPVLDDNGQIRMRGDGKGPLVNFTECTGRSCNYCRTLNGQPLVQDSDPKNQWPGWRADQLSTMFGQRRYIELGKNHLSDLGGWDSSVSSVCGLDGSQLLVDGYKCPHCQSMVIDMQQDPRTDEQIGDAVSKPYPCMRCGRPVLLEEVVSCDVCRANNRQHVQHSIFGNTVLWGLREGEGTNSHLVLRRFETLEQFGASVHPNYLGGKSIQSYINELAQPYEFEKMFAPRTLQEQSKRLELSIPPSFGGGGGQPSSYGQPQQQGLIGTQPGTTMWNQQGQPIAGVPQTMQGQPLPALQAPAPGQQPAPNGQPGAPTFVPPGRPNFGS